jgi:hypothetical protein
MKYGDRLPHVSPGAPTYELRFSRPTVTPSSGAVGGPRETSTWIYAALLHDVQRDQTRRTPKLSRSDAIQGDSLRPTRPHHRRSQVDPCRGRQERPGRLPSDGPPKWPTARVVHSLVHLVSPAPGCRVRRRCGVAQRSSARLALLEVPPWGAATERVLFLTGTPMENRITGFQALVHQLQPDVAARIFAATGVALLRDCSDNLCWWVVGLVAASAPPE